MNKSAPWILRLDLDDDFDNIAGITARKDQQKCQHNDGHLMPKH